MRSHRMNYHWLIILLRYLYLFYEYIFLNVKVDSASPVYAVISKYRKSKITSRQHSIFLENITCLSNKYLSIKNPPKKDKKSKAKRLT